MEFSIFEIIKKEKKNIANVNLISINKLFCKYFFKYILDIKLNLEPNFFNNNISKISNMLFNIFWIIFLISFNTHITIFFMERASLLFSEYIKLSIEKKEKVENLINQAIIFTYNKTIGDTSIEEIIEENKKCIFSNQIKYKKIIKIRDNTYLFIKILDNIIICSDEEIENYKKNNKSIINYLYKIYQHHNTEKIDKYLFFKFNKFFSDFKLEKAINLIKLVVEIVNEISNLDDKNITVGLNTLDKTLEFYESQDQYNNNFEIQNKEIKSQIRGNIYRYIT